MTTSHSEPRTPNPEPRVSLVVAMAENRVIGREGDLPWHLPADLAYFKQLTRGHTVVMGRRTFDSLGRPLPNRRNIVLTRDRQWTHPGVEVVHDWPALQARLEDVAEEVFILGGEQVYRLALPEADRVYLTLIHATVEGDTRFPDLPEAQWRLREQTPRPADAKNTYAMTFQVYERIRPS
ncbi:MAG: dihydrofolate reductase [Phycisphaeraceae bacterium]